MEALPGLRLLLLPALSLALSLALACDRCRRRRRRPCLRGLTPLLSHYSGTHLRQLLPAEVRRMVLSGCSAALAHEASEAPAAAAPWLSSHSAAAAATAAAASWPSPHSFAAAAAVAAAARAAGPRQHLQSRRRYGRRQHAVPLFPPPPLVHHEPGKWLLAG